MSSPVTDTTPAGTRRADPTLVQPLITRLACGETSILVIGGSFWLLYALAVAVAAMRVYDDPTAGTRLPAGEVFGTWAFFGIALPGTLSAFLWSQRKLQAEFPGLAAELDLPDAVRARAAHELHRLPVRAHLANLAAGLTLGLAHDTLLGGVTATLTGLATTPISLLLLVTSLSTICLWVLVFAISAQSIASAVQLARLTRTHLQLNLAPHPAAHSLGVIAARSTLPTLVVLGAMPLLFFDGEAPWAAVVPGALASVLSIGALFLIPLNGLRLRVAEFKAGQIAAVQQAIASLGPMRSDGPRDIERNRARELALLLSLRRELQQISPWPVGTDVIMRVLLYGIIPPLTWIAAAMVEFSLENLL